MKKISIFFSALTVFAVSLNSHASITLPKQSTNNTGVLFVQMAPHAVMQNVDKKNNPLKITLYEVNANVIYFTNRPARKHGKIPTEQFSSLWPKYFKNKLPNVAIETSYKTMKGKIKEITLIGTFSNPVYNAKVHSMTYNVSLKKDQTATSHHLGLTALFFDDVPFNLGGF